MAPAGYGSRVEGVHAVEAAIAAGRVRRVFVERQRASRLSGLLESLPRNAVSHVDDVRQIAETRAPQGIVADCEPLLPADLDSLATDDAAIVVLDHVEDPQNVGAVARSLMAAGATAMVVSSNRAAPLSAAAFKAAAGALEHLSIAVVSSIPEALRRLKGQGVWVVGLDAGGDSDLFGLDLLTEPVAVVIGAEGAGLATLSRKRCDIVASIPMAGGFESLNASVSAALAAFEIMRVRRTPR